MQTLWRASFHFAIQIAFLESPASIHSEEYSLYWEMKFLPTLPQELDWRYMLYIAVLVQWCLELKTGSPFVYQLFPLFFNKRLAYMCIINLKLQILAMLKEEACQWPVFQHIALDDQLSKFVVLQILLHLFCLVC